MSAHDRNFSSGRATAVLFYLVFQVAGLERVEAINITVDYRYDTNGFFNTQEKQDALAAAAARYSAIITTSLSAATLANDSTDPRIAVAHPGLGTTNYQISPATGTANDAIVAAGAGAANEYRGPWSIAANEWILYAGGRSLANAGEGGSATGTNFTPVFTDGSSHVNRGFRASGSVNNLPVWGGYITFDNDGSTNWHFDHTTAAPESTLDFYSIALHEIGHALGLSTGWLEWTSRSSGGQFSGPAAVAAYNADNGTAVSALNEVSSTNHHWQDNTYDSYIFSNANPNYVGTVGASTRQDLLMEPFANFVFPALRRFELTNVDVAALRDVGWSVVPNVTFLAGDYNQNNIVDVADYVLWRNNNNTGVTLPNDSTTGTNDSDYTVWRANFGQTAGSASALASVPEPAGSFLGLSAVVLLAILSGRLSPHRHAPRHGRQRSD